MKKLTTVLLVGALAVSAATTQAFAGHREDKIAIGVGGLILGGVIGSQIERNSHRSPPPVVIYQTPAPVVIERPVVVESRYPRRVVYRTPAPTVVAEGYWKTVTTRTWVPERTITTTDEFGRSVTITEEGHYESSSSRVWVPATVVCD